MTGPQLYRTIDGVLAADMLNEVGQEFTEAYFTQSYVQEFAQVLTKSSSISAKLLPTPYHVMDTWENFHAIADMLDEQFAQWKAAETSANE